MGFKICIIGCGGIATGYHGPSFAQYAATHPDTDLAACCDVDEARAVCFSQRFGFARHYTDFRAMLQAERPDAVCLMVPEHLTCELGCEVLRLGYPTMMEKPPGRTVEEIDRLIAAAEAGGAPVQVAFNRRYLPLLRDLVRRRDAVLRPEQVQHIRYDLTRVGRADPDFSLTAIHGIDAVRYLAGADYARIRFHYQQLPALGATVANVFMDCAMTSGATAHLEFCPVAGVVVERAAVHAHDHTFFAHIPIWNAFDAPGMLQHLVRGALVAEVSGGALSAGHGFEAGGFYAEDASFFDDLRHGRRPVCDLRSARQSVEVMQCMRERKDEYRQDG